MIFSTLPEFDKDLKRLLKKYRTLKTDLMLIQLILKSKPEERPPFSYRIDNLGIETCIIKVKKIACKSLKGKGVNSGIRLVYGHFVDEDKIVYIELYHKNEKANEDRQRLLDNFE